MMDSDTLRNLYKEDAAFAQFGRTASGEWEGCSASFDVQGNPIELPSQYVPDAYREWGQHIYDWQTQCSTLATGWSISRKLKRLMPTVGCEADAVAYNEEIQQTTVDSESSDCQPVFSEDGSWSIPALLDGAIKFKHRVKVWLRGMQYRARAEHCFATAPKQRIRIVHQLKLLDAGWQVLAIEVHRERWEADYNGGAELAGCGGGVPSFSERPRMDPTALSGDWQPQVSLSSGCPVEAADTGGGTVFLPLNTWSRVFQEADRLYLIAGCILDDGTKSISSQQYCHSRLEAIQLGRQAKAF